MIWIDREKVKRPKSSSLLKCRVTLPEVRREKEEKRTQAKEVHFRANPSKSLIQTRHCSILRSSIQHAGYEISPPALPLFQAHYGKKKSQRRKSPPSTQATHHRATSSFRQSLYNPTLRSYSSGPSLLCPSHPGKPSALKPRLFTVLD